ncbi:MAG: SO_0444 family Cu/Zn efflux transporter [Chlorobiaceae bacterium]|nr:SO_0444 family Cu/Zn efflux transporter [Chlorobiaceae bacterium]NTW73590.1 SO_0444 family Cu/Zn efflux transporter [Chlorobiaceae bacterium]
MQNAVNMFSTILEASWAVLLDAAPFVLLGFLVAGLLKAFMPDDFVASHLGGNGFKSILKASAIGVPIPLCSCGVLPAAAGLRKQGAGKGPVASFLISTPETGVDSIAVSWALLDPVMTVARPVAGFLTAIAAGIAVSFSERIGGSVHAEAVATPQGEVSCTSSCCCGHKKPVRTTVVDKLKSGLEFAFGDLLKDVGVWLFAGVVLAGSISALVSPETIERYLSNEYLSMALMLAISVPLYVCATASTPIAAAFALKGISPGAALVFLLAGPATNAASLTVISRILGKRATTVYLAAIVVMSFAAGMAINSLYAWLGLDIRHWIARSSHEDAGPIAIISAVVLIALVLRSYLPQPSKRIRH